jgi:serine/threonine-protein kinase
VHRDVSPQNVLVSASGVVKIVDFGVAKALGRSGETSAGQLKGKVPFMSPEQAKGASLDRRTDVFALGIILYRLATGAHPFLDENDIKTMRNIISRPPMPPRVKNPKLSQEIERIVLKALQKDPARRFQTAAELGAEVEAAMVHEGGRVTDEEVATFVRSTMGERDRKRRAAIRDAALKMDESGHVSNPAIANGPESISGVMLTKTATPPTAVNGEVTAAIPVRASSPSIPDGGVRAEAPPTTSPSAVGPPPAEPHLPSSPTLAALAATRGGTSPSRRTKAIAVGVAIVLGLGLGLFGFSRLPRSSSAPRGGATQPVSPASEAAPPETNQAATTAVPATAAPEGTDLSVDELPDNKRADQGIAEGKGGRPRGYGGKRPGATTADPKATSAPVADKPPATGPATPPTGGSTGGGAAKPNVPAVQDPGF